MSRVRDEGPQPVAEHLIEIPRERVNRALLAGRELRHAQHYIGGLQLWASMHLRTFTIGCFGGGTGLPSLLGGLKRNPWLNVNAVVTMFDSGGSSGVLRDELGVLPPGDVLRCALALARNEREARRVLLARLPTLEHASEMERAAERERNGESLSEAPEGTAAEPRRRAPMRRLGGHTGGNLLLSMMQQYSGDFL